MNPPLQLVLVGVAGSGKTSVGRRLAADLGIGFVDADDFHPPANRARMAAGLPLDDSMRAPWLAAIHAHLRSLACSGRDFVLACSALKHLHRGTLGDGLPGLQWIHLAVPEQRLRERLAARQDHFFPAALLPSQLAAFEPLERGLTLDGDAPLDVVVQRVRAALGR
ncbi:MAG: AAA family ATPase [Planctomycetes bacterium]|nr:AAA family ATPase [Planctomycetota bacterium]